jgi:hypothetical protein
MTKWPPPCGGGFERITSPLAPRAARRDLSAVTLR